MRSRSRLKGTLRTRRIRHSTARRRRPWIVEIPAVSPGAFDLSGRSMRRGTCRSWHCGAPTLPTAICTSSGRRMGAVAAHTYRCKTYDAIAPSGTDHISAPRGTMCCAHFDAACVTTPKWLPRAAGALPLLFHFTNL
jgi:hypothetical protein